MFWEKYLSMKNIHIDVSNPNLIDNKGLAKIKNIKLIQTVKPMFQHTTLLLSF